MPKKTHQEKIKQVEKPKKRSIELTPPKRTKAPQQSPARGVAAKRESKIKKESAQKPLRKAAAEPPAKSKAND